MVSDQLNIFLVEDCYKRCTIKCYSKLKMFRAFANISFTVNNWNGNKKPSCC